MLKKTIPASRAGWLLLGLAEHSRTVGDGDLAVEYRLDQALHLLGEVLAVGVEGDDDLGPGVGEQPVTGAKRGAAAAVDHVAGDGRAVGTWRRPAVPSREPSSTTSVAVAHAADRGRDPVEHLADVVGLVVGGDEDADAIAEALRDSS